MKPQKATIKRGKNMSEKIKYKGNEYEVKYLHEARNGVRGELSVAYIDVNGSQLLAVTERSPKDHYSTKLAKTVLLGRLRKKVAKLESKGKE